MMFKQKTPMEVEPKYCDMAIARWEQYTGGVAELA